MLPGNWPNSKLFKKNFLSKCLGSLAVPGEYFEHGMAGSVKANGSEPKSCLGRVFNFKLDCFVMYAIERHIQAHPSLELKTRPRFCPVN